MSFRGDRYFRVGVYTFVLKIIMGGSCGLTRNLMLAVEVKSINQNMHWR
jgi:hypothetical protein